MSEHALMPFSAAAAARLPTPAAFGEEDFAALWPLWEKQALRYTMDESSSLPEETAEALLRSVCFCVSVGRGEAGGAALAPADALLAGQRALYRQMESAKHLCAEVREVTRGFGSVSLRDTLAAIGDFFTRYDIRFFAHDIPCMIDYPLARPVPESLLGVQFIAAWLGQLLLESRFTACFPPARVHLALHAHNPDYAELLINLFQPVFQNALGLAALGEDPRGLDISTGQRTALRTQLKAASPALLERAAARLCNALQLWGGGMRGFLSEMARTLAPRLAEADAGGWANLFLTLGRR